MSTRSKTDRTIEALCDPNTDALPQTRKLLAGDLIRTANQRRAMATGRLVTPDPLEHTPRLDKIARKYQSAQRTAWIGQFTADAIDFLGNKVLDRVSKNPPGLEPVARGALRQGTNWTLRRLADDLEKEATADLSNKLTWVRRNQGSLFEQLYDMTPERAFRELEGTEAYTFIFQQPLGTLTQQDDSIWKQKQIELLAQLQAEHRLENLVKDAVQDQEIRRTRRDLAVLGRTFKEFTERTTNDLQRLDDDLRSVQQRLQRQEAGVDFLYEAMFYDMPPASQLRAMDLGYGPQLGDERRLQLRARIETAEYWERVIGSVDNACNGTARLLGIAKAFGAPPEAIRNVETVVNVAQTAVHAYAALATGNVLGAASMIAQLFGGPASDPVQETLAREFERVHQAIRQLADQIERNHRELLERLDELLDEVLYSRRLLLEDGRLAQLRQCSIFLQRRRWYAWNAADDHFENYEAAQEHFRQTALNYIPGRLALEEMLASDTRDNLDPLLYVRSYVGSGDQSRAFQQQQIVYRAALQLALRRGPDQEAFLSRFLLPIDGVADVERKLSPSWQWERPEQYMQTPLSSLFQDLLDPYIVTRIVEYLVGFLPYYEWVRSPFAGELWSAKDLLRRKPDRKFPEFLLLRALQIIDVAVAQQNLLAGDCLLHIGDSIFGSDAGEDGRNLLALIESNPVFANNLLIFSFHRALRQRTDADGSGSLRLMTYEFARAQHNPGLLHEVVGSRWNIQRTVSETTGPGTSKTPAGWSARVGSVSIALPSSLDLQTASLRQTQSMLLLLPARARLIGALQMISLPGVLGEDALTYYRVLVSDVIASAVDPGALVRPAC